MNKAIQSNFGRDRIEYFVKTVSDYRMLLIVPTVVCTVLALGYAIFKSNSWTARQSLVIRDDLVGKSFKPGRFESPDSLKSAQETILEIARKPQVISNALKNLGPPPMMLTGRSSWPSEKVIEDVQGTISIGAPNGAEFGKTEVILLSTKASGRERSREFIELLLTEIDWKLREVRSAKIHSMSEELAQAVETARMSFEQSAKRLQEMDARFGADLSTLRSLNLPNASDGSLQKTIIEIRSEQRRQASEVDLAKKQQEMLIKSYEDPAQYLVTSSDLLKMQPRLEQLVAGLSASQLELAKVSGKFTEEHTEVKSAKRAILDIKIQILKEIQASIHALGANIEFGEDRIQKLVDAENKLEARLSELSSARVEYDKLEQEVAKKSEVLGQARQDLVQVQSVGQSTIDLLTRVGEPQVSTRPDGPGKRTIVGAGILGGLLIGLGLIMFTAPPFEDDDQPESTSHREQNQLSSQHLPDVELDVELNSQVPVLDEAASQKPQPAAFTPPVDPNPPEPALPELVQAPASQSGSETSPSELPEVVFQPRNVLAELNAQAQSALSSRKQSQPATEDSANDFHERRVIPTRRKAQTTPAADSEFAAAISKVSEEAKRKFADSKSKPVARVKSITDLFKPDSDSDAPDASLPGTPPPLAEIEIVNEHATFIKISNESLQHPVRADREQAQTTQVEVQQLPTGSQPSQLSNPGHQPATFQPSSTEPLTAQKIQRKSNVRPIDLSKALQGLNTPKPDPQAVTESVTPEVDADLVPPNSESTIGKPGLAPEIKFTSDINDGNNTGDRPRDSKRQSAVTEQLFVKQIYTSMDELDLSSVQNDSLPDTAEPAVTEVDSDDVEQPEIEPARVQDYGGAAGREDVLQWGNEISDALSAAEIVQQLRARQQQAAAEASSASIKHVPLRPANHPINPETDRPEIVLNSRASDDDSTVLDIRRRPAATDEASSPITGASPINEQIKKLNASIADFCDPLKRKKNASQNDDEV